MNRRETVLALIALGAVSGPLASLAQQQTKVWRIGFLGVRPVPPSRDADRLYLTFRDGMRELGYIDGRNVIFEWRSSGVKYEILPRLAADLVRAKVDLIVAAAPPCIKAAQQATTTIPIVMVGVGDVIALGFVTSLARPGGNITGLSNLSTALPFKQVELLRAALPTLSRLAALVNPSHPDYANISTNLRIAAEKARLEMTFVPARSPDEIEGAFVAAAQAHAGAMIVQAESSFILYRQQLAELAIKHRLPSMFPFREHVTAGGLMSYGANVPEQYRRAANFVDRILKGTKPADLPIEQAGTFELVINLKTARALGITIPQSLLVRADEVIQ